MRYRRESPYFPFLRPAGGLLLVLAYLIARHLIIIAAGNQGHQPFGVYLLSLILFLCASMGAALLAHGRHLFDRVHVSQRWATRLAPPIAEERWSSELDSENRQSADSAPRHDPVA